MFKRIENIQREFLWNDLDDHHKYHLLDEMWFKDENNGRGGSSGLSLKCYVAELALRSGVALRFEKNHKKT